jgi:hypothetical protein
MTSKRVLGSISVAVAVAALLAPVPLSAQAAAPSLGSVNIPRKVVAHGQPLAAGTYVIRLSADPVAPVVGQSADGARWVEFTQGGKVKGRELATVVSGAEAKQIAKGALPAAGSAKVQLLKGSEYLRVWINHAGTQYLIYLTMGNG